MLQHPAPQTLHALQRHKAGGSMIYYLISLLAVIFSSWLISEWAHWND
ncbi:MAG: hypothetical protein ACRCYY_00315 [Trueperaceae bacterium]